MIVSVWPASSLRRSRCLLLVELHDVLHEDFLLVEPVVALGFAGHFAAVEIEIVVQGDAVGESLTFVLLQLIGSALPPEVTVWLVRKDDFALRIGERVVAAKGVGGEAQIFVVLERIRYDFRLIFRVRLRGDDRQKSNANHS